MTKLNQRKLIVYLSAAFGLALIFGLVSGLVFHYLPLYIAMWSVFGALLGHCLARISLHIYYKDNSAKMWHVTIFHFVIVGGVLGLILCNTIGGVAIAVATIAGGTMMALGVRFVNYRGGTELIYHIEREMRFYPIGDLPLESEDKTRPLIQNGDECLTIFEAEQRGLKEAAQTAREMLYIIYGVETKEEKKEN